MRPVLLVVAGPNGAGKTTVTVRLRAERWSEGVEYLNPDDIARDRFGDWNSAARTVDGQLGKVYGPLPGWIERVLRDVPRAESFADLRS